MLKVSVNILTRNRAELLEKALASIEGQNFEDFDIVVVDDGSADGTGQKINKFSNNSRHKLSCISQSAQAPKGITFNRQAALENSGGEYIAILDDDDEWIDINKLAKQVKFLDEHPDYVLVGGGIGVESGMENLEFRTRPESDEHIRKSMFIRNNFFTSTVMFRKSSALQAGGFVRDADDFGEDYDLWLRLGKLGKMHNFQEAFAKYRLPHYNRARVKAFLNKQLRLIYREKLKYPRFLLAAILLKLRIILW